MPHERNSHRTVSSTQARAPGTRSRSADSPRSQGEDRWFELYDAAAPPPPAPSRAHLLVVPLVVGALLVVAFARSLMVRALLPLALAACAVAILFQRARRDEAAQRARTAKRSLLLRPEEMRFSPGGDKLARTVLDRSLPFGATLLSTHRRDRLVLLLTSDRGVFHVGTIVDATSQPILMKLLSRATTVAGEDAAFESIGPDGEPVLLTARDFIAFVEELVAGDPACLDRVVVTDTRGAPIVLDEGELRVASCAFDLNAPLEWRALVFQEPFGQVMTLYQGTWIRQGGSEVVLVSLLPSLGPILEVEPGEIATLDRAVLRDLRLMQASAEKPPPREQRHAIERLLMMPIRSSLDRAPRKSRQPVPQRPPLH